jgi:hypothetical protein
MPTKYKSNREPLLELARILNAAWEEHGSLVESAMNEETDPSTAIKASEEIGEVVERIEKVLVKNFDYGAFEESVRDISDPRVKAEVAWMQYGSLKVSLEILTPES